MCPSSSSGCVDHGDESHCYCREDDWCSGEDQERADEILAERDHRQESYGWTSRRDDDEETWALCSTLENKSPKNKQLATSTNGSVSVSKCVHDRPPSNIVAKKNSSKHEMIFLGDDYHPYKYDLNKFILSTDIFPQFLRERCNK